jgi:2',3'-cyclic-nucleotide 2'-phosphodiesterase (5'-nucleotidase family)
MVNLKNYNVILKNFVLFLTFSILLSCQNQRLFITKIEGKKIGITEKASQNEAIDAYIKPYKDKIDTDLKTVLAIAPQTFDKSGTWQTSVGNLFADITFTQGNPVFLKREQKNIDFVLLNNGGIRSIIPKGDVTLKTAYELMPFENELVVIALKSEQVIELVNFIITEKKPHPINGITFTINKENKAKNILILGKLLQSETIYYVATNDYLANGGDNMEFFKKGIKRYSLDYKLRNVLIDYFKAIETLPVATDIRILLEK